MFYDVAGALVSSDMPRTDVPDLREEARMLSFFEHRPGHYLLLAGVALPLFFWNLGGAALWDLDEGRNLTCAYEMMLADNWVVPTFNGELRDHKPALLYWLQILCYSLGGVNEGMGRLPSAAAALATLFVAYELGRRMFSKSTGLLAGLTAATSPMLVGAARFANPDALLNLFAAMTLLFVWMNLQRPRAWLYALTGASSGMAMLAKGPVGLVVPTAIILAFAFWENRWATIFDRRIGWSVLAFAVVAAPWYVLVAVITHAKFLTGFIGTHNIDRFLTTMENHGGSVFYYPVVLLIGTAPWSLFAGGALWAAFWSCRRSANLDWQAPWRRWVAELPRRRRSRLFPLNVAVLGVLPGLLRACDAVWSSFWRSVPGGEPDWDEIRRRVADPTGRGGVPAYRFLTVWIAVYLIFFSLAATKLPNYILPTIVPWTLLSARFLDRWRKDSIVVPRGILAAAVVGMALIGIGIGVGLTVASGVGQASIMRNRFLPALLPYAPIGLTPVIAAAAMGYALWRDRRGAFVSSLVVAATLLLAPLAALAAAALNDIKAPPRVALGPAGRTDVDLRVVGLEAAHLPSLNFYLKRDVLHVGSLDQVADNLKAPIPTYAVLPVSQAEALAKSRPGLAVEISRHDDLYRGRTLVVLANSHAR